MVEIRDADPYPGRITIYVAGTGSITARSLAMPKQAFIDACTKFADVLAGEAPRSPEPTKTAAAS